MMRKEGILRKPEEEETNPFRLDPHITHKNTRRLKMPFEDGKRSLSHFNNSTKARQAASKGPRKTLNGVSHKKAHICFANVNFLNVVCLSG